MTVGKKKLKVEVVVIEFRCANCDEYLCNDRNGSHNFLREDIPRADSIKCDGCDYEMGLPNFVIKFRNGELGA